MNECHLITKLPTELRLKIYGYLLSFDRPIKLRQVVEGSRNLAILRTNRQINREAVSVLYDLNEIVVTRNDFCKRTDASLKTPLKLDQARRLWISTFSRSIACTLSDAGQECDVCQASAMGLIETFVAMPRLKAVVVDITVHLAEFTNFQTQLETNTHLDLRYFDSFRNNICLFRLIGPGFERLSIVFYRFMLKSREYRGGRRVGD